MSWILGLISAALVGAEAAAPNPIVLEVTRDNWFSNVGKEADGNNGAAPHLKLKTIQEMSVIDFDVTALKGRVIKKATLMVKPTGEPHLKRVTVGGIASDWIEGTGTRYEVQAGSSTHNHRRHPDETWTAEGGDLCNVMFGPRGALWGSADATQPDKTGWQKIAVDPRVVAARVGGLSYGFFLYDDTGTEWKRTGEKYEQFPMPNRFIFSRDQNRGVSPRLVVELGDEDKQAPAPPYNVESRSQGLPAGEGILSWVTPADSGGSGTLGFLVTSPAGPVAGERVPLAGKPGERIALHYRDPRPSAGKAVELTIVAVDGAGNRSTGVTAQLPLSQQSPKPLPPPISATPARPGPLPRLGSAGIAVIDELDKIQTVSGEMVPPHPKEYLAQNHLWDAGRREVALEAAKNEFVAFQVVVNGPARGLSAALKFDDAPKIAATIGGYRAVESKKGPMPDPIMPVTRPIDVPGPGQTTASLHVEIYVPHETTPGPHKGRLILTSGRERLELAVNLQVWDFTLPDSLSFLPEMNCYGLPQNERDYYRLGHAHRVVLNRVPYGQNGLVADGCAPKWDGKTLDWTAWDRRFGPLLDGSAFADLPRKSVPIECFYLPLHENWPAAIEPNYNGDYWADRAFTPGYRRQFIEASRQFAAHARQKHWDETLLECFFNGKSDFKRNGWSRGSSPWLLDEPSNYQDFWALRFFGQMFHEGINLAPAGKAKLTFRADISRPQWQRDLMDDVLDVNVCSGAFRQYRPMVLERKDRLGQVLFEYGGSNAIESSNIQPAAWSLDVWTLGGDGVLPWQTIGTAGSWDKADELSLFYPGRTGGPPVPSVRLKSYRRGQQDVEYLTLYGQVSGEPRWAVARGVRESLALAGERRGSGFTGGEDAGLIDFGRLSAADLWALRRRIGAAISAAHPPAKKKLVDLRTPPRHPGPLEAKFVSP